MVQYMRDVLGAILAIHFALKCNRKKSKPYGLICLKFKLERK